MIKILIGVFHFLIFLSGGVIRLSQVKCPETLILIGRVIVTIIILIIMSKWI
jgi:hypothetical protein